MEDNDPSRRQYAQPPYESPSQPQPGTGQPLGQYAASDERVQPAAYPRQSPTASGSVRMGGDAQSFGFGADTVYSAGASSPQTMHFALQMQAQGVQAPYANVMYGMGQSNPPTGLQSPFGASPIRYRARAPSTSTAAAFGQSPSPQYYQTANPFPTASPMAHLSNQSMSAQYPSSAYVQAGMSSSPTYSTNVMNPSPSAAQSSYPQSSQQAAQSPHAASQAFSRYRTQIRTIFTKVREGSISDLGSHLLEISRYLLGNAEALGLTHDDPNAHDARAARDARTELWDEFNRAWLTTLQAQHDRTPRMIRAGRLQALMSTQTLETLSRALVRFCDDLERHGLVDYQIGVAEEEIMGLLIRCINLLNPTAAPAGARSRHQSRSSGSGRRTSR